VRPAIGAATGGLVTGLPGGLPIIFDGELLGGIGIGSGSGEQDVEVANAALARIGALQW
jgi:glc operon protein GlcG